MSSAGSSSLRGSSSDSSRQTASGNPVQDQLVQVDSRPSISSSLAAASPGEIYRRHTPLSPDRAKPTAFSLPQPLLDSSPPSKIAFLNPSASSDRSNASPAFASRASRLAGASFTPPDMSVRALMARHQYLLRTMAILVVLCAIYLYFAVSMDDEGLSCQGLRGALLAECREQLKTRSLATRKGRGGDSAGAEKTEGSGRFGGGGEDGDGGEGQIGRVGVIQTEEKERNEGSAYHAEEAGTVGLNAAEERAGDRRVRLNVTD